MLTGKTAGKSRVAAWVCRVASVGDCLALAGCALASVINLTCVDVSGLTVFQKTWILRWLYDYDRKKIDVCEKGLMMHVYVFLSVWWLAVKGGVILGAWRWLSLVAFFVGVALDGEWLRFFKAAWVALAMIGVWFGVVK